MNRKTLCGLIGLALAAASFGSQAQDYDDRYYFAGWLGYYDNDSDRQTDDGSLYGSIGIGRWISPQASIDVFVDRTTRTRKDPFATSNWDNNSFGTSLRWHFGDWGHWRPYIMGGVGVSHHDANNTSDGWDPFAQAGVGLAKAYNDDVQFRTELAYRHDWDDETLPEEDGFGDWMFNIGVTIAIGDAPEPVAVEPAPAEPQPDCATLDDDKDGVNNCDDKCPATAAGQIVGPDGCPQDVVIDLRGVEFKFDRPDQGETEIEPTLKEPTSEGIAILDQAVDTLKRYPQVRVEVAGHTDAIGTEEYNQGLSERRARVVYDYLVAHGVDPARLVGPNGYGELRPIAPNTNPDGSDNPEGRQRNRRTELGVQQ